MRTVLIFILTFLSAIAFGQGFSYPSINVKGKQLNDFVPHGWIILDSAKGDLNKDRSEDIVLILQHKDSVSLVNDLEDTVLTQPRVLIILFRNDTGNSFDLIEQSNSFILKNDDPKISDPFMELNIEAGVMEIKFGIFHNMGSWYITNTSYKFRYQQSEFVLIGAEYFSIHRATLDFEQYSYNFLTKKRSLTRGNEDKGTKKITWKTLNISSLKTLKTFTAPFTWQIETDVYL